MTENFRAPNCKVKARPFDVGANLIARTGHTALWLLGDIAKFSEPERQIPLAWGKDFRDPIAAIEVYPAATLASRGVESIGKKHREVRERIISQLAGVDFLNFEEVKASAVEDDNVLDAVVCALAGPDFLRGDVIEPEPSQREIAWREGWIWCKKPEKPEFGRQ